MKPALPSDRSFGWTFTGVFTLVAFFQPWLLALAAATALVTLIRAHWLAPFNRAWMKLGEVLHHVVSPVVLGRDLFRRVHAGRPGDARVSGATRWPGASSPRRRATGCGATRRDRRTTASATCSRRNGNGFRLQMWRFLGARRKFWLLPIILVIVLLGGLLVLAQGSVVAPFIYTLFYPMRVLGISAYYHDSAAALVRDGHVSPPRRRSASRARSTTRDSRTTRSAPAWRAPARARRRDRLRRVLRQAVPQVRAPARDLPRVRAARLHLVPQGAAAVGQGKAVPEDTILKEMKNSTPASTGTRG